MAAREQQDAPWRQQHRAKLVQSATSSDTTIAKRVLAISGLGNIGDKDDVDLLQNALKDRDSRIRVQAAKSLRNMKGYAINKMLIQAVIDDPVEEVRILLSNVSTKLNR